MAPGTVAASREPQTLPSVFQQPPFAELPHFRAGQIVDRNAGACREQVAINALPAAQAEHQLRSSLAVAEDHAAGREGTHHGQPGPGL